MSDLVSRREERGFVRFHPADGGSANGELVQGEHAQHLRADIAAWLRDDPPADELPPPFRAWLAAFCAGAGAEERGA